MRGNLLNGIISAVVGFLAGLAAVWFLQDGSVPEQKPESAAVPAKMDELEVARLKVTDGIMVYHSETGEPLIELKDGVVLAKKEVLSRFVGGMEMVGQKLQITAGDPSASDPPIFCELGAADGGQGAYIAMLSPKGTHSLNIGFDKNETGFVVSRNNEDSSMTAQAVLPLPKKGEQEPAAAAAPIEEPALLSDVNSKPERLAMTPSAETSPGRKQPGGIPMLSPSTPR